MEDVEHACPVGMDEAEVKERLGATGTACSVLYGVEPTDVPREPDSWNVLVTGRLVAASGAEHDRFDTSEINRRLSPIRVVDEAVDDIVIAELDIDTTTGRRTPAR